MRFAVAIEFILILDLFLQIGERHHYQRRNSFSIPFFQISQIYFDSHHLQISRRKIAAHFSNLQKWVWYLW